MKSTIISTLVVAGQYLAQGRTLSAANFEGPHVKRALQQGTNCASMNASIVHQLHFNKCSSCMHGYPLTDANPY